MAVYLIHIAIYTYFLTFYFRWAIGNNFYSNLTPIIFSDDPMAVPSFLHEHKLLPDSCECTTQIQSGEIKSITKAKDLASTLWCEHSSTYDNKRAVQPLVDNPGTGHSIKRTRTDDETQYQYRKRRIEEHRQERYK
jgi:hypothetical protein